LTVHAVASTPAPQAVVCVHPQAHLTSGLWVDMVATVV